MSHDRGNSRDTLASEWKKFDLDVGAQRQMGDGKQAHSEITDIDTNGLHAASFSEYAHRSIEQLAFSAAPVWFEIASEKHSKSGGWAQDNERLERG